MVVLSVPQRISGMPVTIGIVIVRHRRPEKISGRRFRDMSKGADVVSLGQPTVNRDCCPKKIDLSDFDFFRAPEPKSRQAPISSHMGIDLTVSGSIGP